MGEVLEVVIRAPGDPLYSEFPKEYRTFDLASKGSEAPPKGGRRRSAWRGWSLVDLPALCGRTALAGSVVYFSISCFLNEFT